MPSSTRSPSCCLHDLGRGKCLTATHSKVILATNDRNKHTPATRALGCIDLIHVESGLNLLSIGVRRRPLSLFVALYIRFCLSPHSVHGLFIAWILGRPKKHLHKVRPCFRQSPLGTPMFRPVMRLAIERFVLRDKLYPVLALYCPGIQYL